MIIMSEYLYDTHVHTAETSACAHVAAADVVARYARSGYSGLVITDHLHPEYLSRIDTEHNWDKAMDHYLFGYRAAKKRGEELGLDILLGAELRFPQNDNDYLVYGIDEQWLRSHPYLCCTSAMEFFDQFHKDVLIIHAHPYRDGNTVVFEDAVHGSELINAHPRHENHNELALELCRRHPEYYRLAGSDAHDDGDDSHAGVFLPQRVHDSFAYKDMIESRRFRLWAPEFPTLLAEDIALRTAQGEPLL